MSASILREVWSSAPEDDIAVLEVGNTGADVESFSYGYMRRHSKQLAEGLSSQLPKHGTCVAVLLLPRGAIHMAVTVALLLSGRASVCPVPPTAPFSFLVRAVDAFAGGVLRFIAMGQTAARLRSLWPRLNAVAVASAVELTLIVLEPFLEGRGATVAGLASKNGHRIAPFTLLTSGSRKLKSVVFSESALLSRCQWAAEFLRLGSTSIYAHRAPVGFVDALTEVWPVLLAGGQVAVCPEEEGGGGFWRWLGAAGATHCTVVPALLDECGLQRLSLPSLKVVVSSGDALRQRSVDLFQSHFPDARLVNLYGLTECCGDCLLFEVSSCAKEKGFIQTEATKAVDDLVVERSLLVPVGQPLPGVEARILPHGAGPDGHECGEGESGMLWVRGPVLAEGYWGAGDVVLDTLSRCDGSDHTCFVGQGQNRWLRTGDMAWRSSGVIHFAGRNGDLLLKVCGVKIWVEDFREQILTRLKDAVRCEQPAKRSRHSLSTNVDKEEEAMRTLRRAALRGPETKVEIEICARQKLEPKCTADEVVVFATGELLTTCLRTAAQEALQETLGLITIAAPLPLRVLHIDTLPRLANLKPDWQAFARILEETTAAATNDANPIDDGVASLVLNVSRRLAQDPRVQAGDDLISEWGFSSLLLARLVESLNGILGCGLTLLRVLEECSGSGPQRKPCTPQFVAEILSGPTPDPVTSAEFKVEDSQLDSYHVDAAPELELASPGYLPPSRCAWSVHMGKCVDAPVLVLPPERGSDEPLLVAGSVGGTIACVRADGHVIWTRHVNDRCVARCAALAGPQRQVVVPTWGGFLYCFGLLDGELYWLYNLGAKSRSGPLVFAGSIWAGTYAGDVCQVDGAGRCRGKRLLDRSGIADLSTASGLLVVVCLHGLVFGLVADSTSTPVWKTELGCPAFRAPLSSRDGSVSLFGCVKGVVGIRSADGVILWRQASSEIYMPILNLEAPADLKAAFVADASGRVFAVGYDGCILGVLQLEGIPAAVAAAGCTCIICLRNGTGASLVGIALEPSQRCKHVGGAESYDVAGVAATMACSSESRADQKTDSYKLVRLWQISLAQLEGFHRDMFQCHALHVLPDRRLVLGARDDFLHAVV